VAVTRKKLLKRGGMSLAIRWNQFILFTLEVTEHEYLGEERYWKALIMKF
jgi:hypothetical protein